MQRRKTTTNNIRNQKRHGCQYEARIYHRNKFMNNAIIYNISHEGLLMEAHNNLETGTIIDVRFGLTLDCTGKDIEFKIPAFVIHREADFLGVWIDGEDIALKEFINQLISNINPM